MSVVTDTVLKVVLTMIWDDGNLIQNVLNAFITGGSGPWDDVDVVSDARTWAGLLATDMNADTSDELSGSQVQVYEFDTGDQDWDEVGAEAWGWGPSLATDQLPRGVAALINAKTVDPDVNAKKYVGGLTEAAVTDGLWTGAILTVLGNYADTWITPYVGGTTGATWTPGCWSVKNKTFHQFSGNVIIPTIPAYQRRRKRGVGV